MDLIIQVFSIITGILIFIVGFGFHWVGQFISQVNRDLAIRMGIWETDKSVAWTGLREIPAERRG